LAICGWLLAGGVGQVHGGVFDVTSYGAVGDDATDNTAALLDAELKANGGKPNDL